MIVYRKKTEIKGKKVEENKAPLSMALTEHFYLDFIHLEFFLCSWMLYVLLIYLTSRKNVLFESGFLAHRTLRKKTTLVNILLWLKLVYIVFRHLLTGCRYKNYGKIKTRA